MNQLRKNIMRRIYYVFALKIALHPLTLHALMMLLCFYALSRVVSIPNVWANMMEVKVGELSHFLIGALLNTSMLTIILLAAISLISLSLIRFVISHGTRFGRMETV